MLLRQGSSDRPRVRSIIDVVANKKADGKKTTTQKKNTTLRYLFTNGAYIIAFLTKLIRPPPQE